MAVWNVSELCRTGQSVQYKEQNEKPKENNISKRKSLDIQSISLACSQQATPSNKERDNWEHRTGKNKQGHLA